MLWFSSEVLSTFIQIIGIFSFKLKKDNSLGYNIFINKQPYSCLLEGGPSAVPPTPLGLGLAFSFALYLY